jgi:hypothetical protein
LAIDVFPGKSGGPSTFELMPTEEVEQQRVGKVIIRAGQLHGRDYVLGVDAEGGTFVAVKIPAWHPWLGIHALSHLDSEVDVGLNHVFWDDSGDWWAIRMTLSCCYPLEAMPFAEELAIRVLAAHGKTIAVPKVPVSLPTTLFQ